MELRQLSTFRTVATTLNFTRAAEALNYVPSNVTMQIKALEEELGVRLFDRLGKQLALTSAGKRFLARAQDILDTVEEARGVVHEEGEGQIGGTVTISANEVLCAYRLPDVFRRFRARCPGARLLFRSVPNQELRQTLFDGSADVVFLLEEPIRSSALAVESLLGEPFRFYASPDHPLATRTGLRLDDFQGETFLTNERGCIYRTLFDRALGAEGVDRVTYLEFQSAEAIKQCAIAGIGVAFLPDLAVQTEAERGELVALPRRIPDLNVHTQMAWHKDKWLSPALAAFIETAREVLGGERQGAQPSGAPSGLPESRRI
ncbi:LysR family transcriptional regulator [Paenibacillus albicereus]|uniref:LysR family transcriptional regulator n=1 Tax=Paenibacillus albicereus TaxID=2726185 RepID=A0A6H2GTR6_9BACL|nr:LysR family transcriptional regulator [Paenibacillus albicereus]QJC50823.1 LysR family transcriptional regulator [Paenibacillus albicereus]